MIFLKNNTIAFLVGILIIVSIATFLIAPSNLVYITGHSSSGTSSTAFNLTSEVSILVTGVIDFGAGRVYSNASNAILDSELGTGESNSSYFGWQDISGITGLDVSNSFSSVIYDGAQDVFIGYGRGSSYYETWEFNYSSKQWTNITNTTGAPSMLTGYAQAYDSATGEIFLLGGQDHAFNFINETWKLNSSMQWEKVTTTNPVPHPQVYYEGMVFDKSRNVLIVFGGNWSDETWELNLSNYEWTNKTKSSRPPGRSHPGMVFDTARNVTVLVAGDSSYGFATNVNETWEYNGTDSVNVTGSINGVPDASAAPLIYFDSIREKTVLLYYNLYDNIHETWEYNGTAWINANASWPLVSHMYQMIDFNPVIQKGVLFGQVDAVNNDSEYGNITVSGGGGPGGGCINGTWSFASGFIYVENDGTVNISVNVTSDKNADQFIGGTSPSYMIKGVVGESGACSSLVTTYTEVSNSTETPLAICPLLKFQNDADMFKVPAILIVPSDVATGQHNSTLTFSATQAG